MIGMAGQLSREELLNIIRKLLNGDFEEDEAEELLQILKLNVQDPHITDYIYWPSEYTSPPREMSAEEIVDRALSYKTKVDTSKKPTYVANRDDFSSVSSHQEPIANIYSVDEYATTATADEVRDRYTAGDRNFRSLNLSGADLSRTDLSGADLSFSNLQEVNLSQANLANTNLEAANLSDANLYFTNLRGVKISADTVFPKKGRRIYEIVNGLVSDKNFSHAVLRGMDLDRSNLSGFNLKQALFEESSLDGADFRNAILVEASFIRSSLNGAVMSGVDLSSATIDLCDAENANFENANLSGSKLPGSNFRQANFKKANLSKSWLGSHYQSTDFSDVDFGNANLENADLRQAIFTGANFSGANLSGVIYDDSTIWPEGFNLSLLNS
jgi:uncharacterized protein YjbI with pentapeptide repeats